MSPPRSHSIEDGRATDSGEALVVEASSRIVSTGLSGRRERSRLSSERVRDDCVRENAALRGE